MSDMGPRRPLILDSGALSALTSASHRTTQARVWVALDLNVAVVVPTIVLTETMNGSATDARLWWLVNRFVSVDLTTTLASYAGALRERAERVRKKKRDLTVDAIVAATAIAWAPSLLMTGDADDMRLLVGEADVKVQSLEQ